MLVNIAGDLLSGVSFGSSLESVLKTFAKSVQDARYNKGAVQVLTKRIRELLKSMLDILLDTSDAFQG